MKENKVRQYIKQVVENMPTDWLNLTTHRLDIYEEKLAKTQFLAQFNDLFEANNATSTALNNLPTAYDYIRLGHPLSSVLEWAIAQLNEIPAENVISFSSKTTPILAVLRKNLLNQKPTQIAYTEPLNVVFDATLLQEVYGYQFELKQVNSVEEVQSFNGSTIFVSTQKEIGVNHNHTNVDFFVDVYHQLGSVLVVNGVANSAYVSDIQHVRRRETIAMTPANALVALHALVVQKPIIPPQNTVDTSTTQVVNSIQQITGAPTQALVASSGLSIQYAIMMGLIHDALEVHPNKPIKIIVPTNCYGGTNDQARRVAACLANVEVVDLAVDGENNMVQSIDTVLHQLATQDAIPYIIAEIPTNPRVEVPDLHQLNDVLRKTRKTASGETAIDPVFILDQTFCPNVHFLGENDILSSVRTISYASGSKFPSGGRCTAGYCVGNKKTQGLMNKIALHLQLCDNEATPLQMEILAQQLPSMNQRIIDAYANTREFVAFIEEKLPDAKINFVSPELAEQGFTPSVFSLDLPTKGNTDEEREAYKRALNLQLINLMISEIPNESKFCVSYGQLKGCYWTIPATSTQGTTKEGDKDYIVRASLSPNVNLDKHKEVFMKFVQSI